MKFFITRGAEYNDAFNLDKGSAFVVSDIDFVNFVPSNLLAICIKNVFGEDFAISNPSELNKDFVHGFMDFFTSSVAEATTDFENFSL